MPRQNCVRPLGMLVATSVVLDASPIPILCVVIALFPWSFEEYSAPILRLNTMVQILTPQWAVQTLAHGYVPDIHLTAELLAKKVTAI